MRWTSAQVVTYADEAARYFDLPGRAAIHEPTDRAGRYARYVFLRLTADDPPQLETEIARLAGVTDLTAARREARQWAATSPAVAVASVALRGRIGSDGGSTETETTAGNHRA